MQKTKKIAQKNPLMTRTICAALLAGLLNACSSGSGDSKTGGNDDNTDGVVQASGKLLDTTPINVPSGLPAASSALIFDYDMDAVTGGKTTARAQLFEPVGQVPNNGYPLVVWAHGTTGIANSCTPSLSFEEFSNATAINSLLAAGYAVLAPDYEGFGTPTIHPFYVRSSHANAVLAAIPAVHEIENTELSAEWALVGHSQGGHVALATARAEQAPEFPLQAVVALAPGTDLQPMSERAFEAVDLALAQGQLLNAGERVLFQNVVGAYIAQAIALVEPSFDPTVLFGDDVASLLDRALNEESCGDFALAINEALSKHVITGGTLANFGGLKRDWFTNPTVANLLQQEELGDETQSAPLLVVHGDADRQIPITASEAFVDRQRSLGTNVTFRAVSGARHGDVARAEFGITLDWLTQQFPVQ